MTEDTGKPWRVSNVSDYKPTQARVGRQFPSQPYATREAALQSRDQFVAGRRPRANGRPWCTASASTPTSTPPAASRPSRSTRLGQIFWLQGRYVFQVQLEANGSRKTVSAATLALGRQAAEKIKSLVD